MADSTPPKNRMIAFAGIGFELIGLLLGGAFLGQYLDTKYAVEGWWTAGLVILALIGWLVHLIVMLKSFQASEP